VTLLRWLRGQARYALRLRIAAVSVAALVLATLAFASHLHEPDEVHQADDTPCALCLHFERLGTTPEAHPAVAQAPVADATAPAAPTALPGRMSVRAYRSRAPPA